MCWCGVAARTSATSSTSGQNGRTRSNGSSASSSSVGAFQPFAISSRPFSRITRTGPFSPCSVARPSHPDASGPSSASSACRAFHAIANLAMPRFPCAASIACRRSARVCPGCSDSTLRSHSSRPASAALSAVSRDPWNASRRTGPSGSTRSTSSRRARRNARRALLSPFKVPLWKCTAAACPSASRDRLLCSPSTPISPWRQAASSTITAATSPMAFGFSWNKLECGKIQRSALRSICAW